jgi:glycosyltransferase involved in cell wall biosynthesis
VRITYLVDSPTFGGAETTVIQLLRHLPAAYDRTVVATEPIPGPLAAAARSRGQLVSVAPVGRDASRVPALQATLAATAPDVVHANLIDPASNWLLLEAAAGVPDATAVATVHMIGDLGCRSLLSATYRRLDAVIAVSDEVRGLLVDGLGLSSQAVWTVTNGVDPLPVVRRPVRSPLVVGGLGRLTAQKGFDLLLAATRQLVSWGHSFQVRIAGEGRDRRVLEAASVRLPVRFVGFRSDVAAYLAGLDVFCLPSRAEALPLALLEAMMTGLPCVAAAVGQIPAAVGNAVDLVPPEDPEALARALARLLRDPDRRRHLGQRAAVLAHREFDVRHVVAKVQDVYTPSWPARGRSSRSGLQGIPPGHAASVRCARPGARAW